jgi:DNA replication protein DnaD
MKNIQLFDGSFESQEAIDLLTQMVHVKIKYHEAKISSLSNEEDVKMRENRIKLLQNELLELRDFIEKTPGKIKVSGELTLNQLS